MFNKLVYVLMGVVITGSLLFMSCANQQAPSQKSPTPIIVDAGKDVGSAANTIEGTTGKIEAEAKAGQAATPAAAKPALDPHWSEILTQAGVQRNVVTNLKQTQSDLADAQKKSTDLEKQLGDTQAKLKDAEDGITKQIRQKYMMYSGFMFFGAIIGIGVGLYMQSKIIMLIGGLMGAGCVAAITVAQVAQLIPWFAGGAAVLVVGILVYSFWKNHGNLNLFKNAFTQTVAVVENAKPQMTTAGRKLIFGDGAVNGIAHTIQSADTQALVDKARAEIEKAPSVPGTVAADWDGNGVVDENDEKFHAAQLVQQAAAKAMAQAAAVPTANSLSTSGLKRRTGGRKVSGPQGVSTSRILFN